MRIAFISIVREPWGGSEELWARAAKSALEEGHSVFISALEIARDSSRFQALVQAGAKLELRRGYIPPGTGTYTRVARKGLNFLMNNVQNPFGPLFSWNPDLIVYTGSVYSIKDDPELLWLLKKHPVPFLINTQVNVEFGKPLHADEAWVIKEAFQRASQVCFVSERNRDVAERHLLTRISNAVVIRNPVNLSSTEAISFPESQGAAQWAMVANLLVNHKGHDILFDVLRNEKWLQRDWRLNIFGGGQDEGYLKSLSQFYGLEDRLVFHGRISDIRAVWQQNQVLLMPSLCEGIPLAVVEAMLCGRPVLATDVGGHMEWIQEGKEGWIAEGANRVSLDRAMERAWQDRARWADMGRKAHERALAQFDPEAAKTFLNIIIAHGRRS